MSLNWTLYILICNQRDLIFHGLLGCRETRLKYLFAHTYSTGVEISCCVAKRFTRLDNGGDDLVCRKWKHSSSDQRWIGTGFFILCLLNANDPKAVLAKIPTMCMLSIKWVFQQRDPESEKLFQFNLSSFFHLAFLYNLGIRTTRFCISVSLPSH